MGKSKSSPHLAITSAQEREMHGSASQCYYGTNRIEIECSYIDVSISYMKERRVIMLECHKMLTSLRFSKERNNGEAGAIIALSSVETGEP